MANKEKYNYYKINTMKSQKHTLGQTLMLVGIRVIIAALSATFLAAAAYVIFELITNPAQFNSVGG